MVLLHRHQKEPRAVEVLCHEWLGRVGVKTLFIESGAAWENGHVESFDGKLLDREAFDTVLEAKVLVEQWRQAYTPSGRTASWATRHRLPRNCIPVRSPRLRLGNRTGLVS